MCGPSERDLVWGVSEAVGVGGAGAAVSTGAATGPNIFLFSRLFTLMLTVAPSPDFQPTPRQPGARTERRARVAGGPAPRDRFAGLGIAVPILYNVCQ